MGRAIIKSFPNDDALAAAAASSWIDTIAAAADRGITVAVSGGRVMRKFFAAVVVLSASRKVDFNRVEVFWADERCVPPDDPESNYRLVREALLEPTRIPNGNIHRLAGELPPASAAQAATNDMRRVLGAHTEVIPVLDLVLLGMGEDGHVASLFPNNMDAATDNTAVFLAVADAPKPPPDRITLGYGPLAAARAVWVLASGPAKREALRDSLAAYGNTPLARVIARRAETTVFTDITC